MKKVLALVLLLAVMCMPSYGAAKPDKEIVILYTNDVHCGVDEQIGYAGVEYYKHQVEQVTPYVTLVDAGDWAQGATMGMIAQGRYILEIMNAMNYDIAVPGNHEFDYGWGMFERLAANLKCGFVCCNLKDLRTGEPVFKPYKILTYGDVKVAFVGATTPESITKSTPSYFMDDSGKYIYDFDGEQTGEKLVATIQKAVDDARAEGVDYVILVGHLGEYDNITKPEWTAPFIATKTKGIDVFIDGHSHEITPALHFNNAEGKDVVITQSGTKLHNIGQVVIRTDGTIWTELVSDVDSRDEKINTLISDIKKRYEDTMNQPLSYTSFDLRVKDDAGEWVIRDAENGLCNLATDAMLYSAKSTETGRADVGLYNAGGLRSNINAGTIRFNDALAVMPFNNTVVIVEMSGQTLLDELEHGVRMLPSRNGGLLHVAGMTYTVDTRIPTPIKVDDRNILLSIEGERRVKDAKINGEPVDPEKMYKVVSISYVLTALGDGHVFKGARLIEPDYATASDVFAGYIRTFEVLPERYAHGEGRMSVIK
ncbi:MAG: bifunctional metallophosphatase/5'-nucleotidase [Synergistaceae bacterium]|nr:bifunctional metallophosphatase/5'-nucleotidase [Synergistaceae bacterium]